MLITNETANQSYSLTMEPLLSIISRKFNPPIHINQECPLKMSLQWLTKVFHCSSPKFSNKNLVLSINSLQLTDKDLFRIIIRELIIEDS